jgi:hypothetical protein
MEPGDKVIVARRQAFTTQRKPMLGTFAGNLGEGRVAVMLPGEDWPSHFRRTEVQPYSEALWQAWQQWLCNAKALEEQQRQLCAGRTPSELLTERMWWSTTP